MADKHRIQYDSAKEDAFLVHTEDGIHKFKRTPEGLYAYKPPEEFFEQNTRANGYAKEASNRLVKMSNAKKER